MSDCTSFTRIPHPAWEQRKLGEFDIKTGPFGSTLHAEDYVACGTPIVTTEHFKEGELPSIGSGIPQVGDRDAARLSQFKLQKHDIVFSRVGSVDLNAEVKDAQVGWLFSGRVLRLRTDRGINSTYLHYELGTVRVRSSIIERAVGLTMASINTRILGDTAFFVPATITEQRRIGAFFDRLDSLITLHQRKYDGCAYPLFFLRKVHAMQETITSESLFCDYYTQWVKTYKEGAIRDVTMGKYRLAQSWLGKLIPELKLADMDRTAYQRLINGYAQHHERQTTMDFHHQIKGAILDAVDEGLIPRDPTRKVIIKGKQPRIKKMKYLNQFELHAMLADLDLGAEASWDWLILLIAKTGLRFSEALGLTPDDFDFAHQTLSVSKTWDYKNGGGFVPTKNESSVRKVQLDWQLIMQLSGLLKNLPHDKPIFVHGKVYNSTVNDVLARHCKNVDVPVISIHGLRHTHASLLLFAGVSIASVSRRLGHASMTTTQETYLHVIRELENKDVDIVMRALSTLI
jgi:integrase